MRRRHSRQSRLGITLVEMMVGIAIVGVVVAVAVPSLTGLLERRRVIAVAGEVASFFAQARSESMIAADKVNLHMEPVPTNVGNFSCLRLSTDALTDVCTCDRVAAKVCSTGQGRLLREYLLERNTSVTFVAAGNWRADLPYVVGFQRGAFSSGVSNVRITVTGQRTQAQLRVEYNDAGRVRTCSPDGTISGFPACS